MRTGAGLLGSSISFRIATGPREGQKLFTLQTLPAEPDAPRPEVAEGSGFSLHAGVAAKASQRDKVERLARYVSRPPVATGRLSLTRGGNVRYALTNRQDCRFARPQAARRAGHRDVPGEHTVSRRHHPGDVAPGILPSALRASLRLSKIAPGDLVEPEGFIARLVALVPKPRAHLTRYHGVFGPASPDRVRIVPGTRTAASEARGECSVSDRQRTMSWAERLKRVFAIDIETCRQCGGHLRVIASIDESAVVERILEHLRHTAEPVISAHPNRAPSQGDRLV